MTHRRPLARPRDGVMKDGTIRYRARWFDCEVCALIPKCSPNAVARKIVRSIYEAARDRARAIAKTAAYAISRRERKKVEMLFAHLKRILRLDRLRLGGPNGARDESYWPPPPRICGYWRRSFRFRRRTSRVRRSGRPRPRSQPPPTPVATLPQAAFFNEIDPLQPFKIGSTNER
jgi:hypothetical protein